MLSRDERISGYQLAMLLISGVVTTAVLLLPGNVTFLALRDAWLAPVMAAPFGALVIWISAKLAKEFPNAIIVEYAPKALGPFFGNLVGTLVTWYFFHLCSLVTREFGDFIVATTMPRTPMPVVLGIGIISVALAVRGGLENLGRLSEIFTPISFVLIGIVLLVAAPKMDMTHLQPFLEFGPVPVLKAGFVTQVFVGELVLLTVLFASVDNLDEAVTASYWALFGIVAILAVVIAATIASLGDLTARYTFPFFTLARTEGIGPAVARIDPLVIGFWIGGVALKINVFLYATSISFARLLHLPDYRPIVVPMALVVAVYSLAQMPNIVDLANFITFTSPVYFLLLELVPGIVLFAAYLRRIGD